MHQSGGHAFGRDDLMGSRSNIEWGSAMTGTTLLRRYTFKLYPNAAQAAALTEQARMCASLWNALLEMRETHRRRALQRGDKKTSLTAFDQGKDITALRAELPEWRAQ